MKRFFCICGQELFFDSEHCVNCQRLAGFNQERGELLALQKNGSTWIDSRTGNRYRLCTNRRDYQACNGIINIESDTTQCGYCQFNRYIPDLSRINNLARWRRIEKAKRRTLFGIERLGLPFEYQIGNETRRLTFDFLENQEDETGEIVHFVSTGHLNGLITLNVLEADESHVEAQKSNLVERYRSLVGHFRHEMGHFVEGFLLNDNEEFIQLFGDPKLDYAATLEQHYQNGPSADWEVEYISAYASSHPVEDWAECFAHYLHQIDTLETAAAWGIGKFRQGKQTFNDHMAAWMDLAVPLNELNRSLGQEDAYPFTMSDAVKNKLAFVHKVIGHANH